MESTETSPQSPPVEEQPNKPKGLFSYNGRCMVNEVEFYRLDNGAGRESVFLNSKDFTREHAEQLAEQLTKLADESSTT